MHHLKAVTFCVYTIKSLRMDVYEGKSLKEIRHDRQCFQKEKKYMTQQMIKEKTKMKTYSHNRREKRKEIGK